MQLMGTGAGRGRAICTIRIRGDLHFARRGKRKKMMGSARCSDAVLFSATPKRCLIDAKDLSRIMEGLCLREDSPNVFLFDQ